MLIAGCTSYEATKKEDGAGTTIKPPELPKTPAEKEVTPPAGPTGADTKAAKVNEFTIEGSEFKFSPSTISVSKGDKVKITFKNTGTVVHNLVIDGLGVSTKTIPNGQTDTVEFTADKTGTFEFYCSVDAHRQKGMEGKATVA